MQRGEQTAAAQRENDSLGSRKEEKSGFSQTHHFPWTKALLEPNIIAAGWLREFLSSDEELMRRGFPRLLPLPVPTSCL